MTLLILMFAIAILIELCWPIFIARWSTRRYQVGWRIFFIGALTFLLSQVGHIPFLQWLTGLFTRGILPNPSPEFAPYFNAIVLGLAAGIFEETARLIAYLLLKQRGNSFGAAVTLGAGHGGLESIIVGFAVLANVVLMLVAPQLPADSGLIPADVRTALLANADAFWASPWYVPLLGAFERVGAVLLHILLSVMVWRAVAQRSVLWFIAALLWHAVVDALAVLGTNFGLTPLMIEAGFFVVTLIDIALLYALWRRFNKPAPLDEEVVQTG